MDEHIYIVAYDISCPKRWRRVFRTMKGYGQWIQLSVFQCRLSRKRHIELMATLHDLIDQSEDHVIAMDVGPADKVDPKVTSLGKSFTAIAREPIIV